MGAVGVSGAFDARALLPWVRRFSRTTPGVIVALALGIAALCATAGLVSAGQIDERIAHQRHLLEHSEPVTFAAQDLYAELSAADAAAASAFLSGGMQTAPMRERYERALARASSALADATGSPAGTETRTAVAELTEQLTTYTGLVEAARANNGQGFPIGSAYLREASALMQKQILPSAERIYNTDLNAMEVDQKAIESIPAAGAVLLGLGFAGICLGTVVMAARTNRQFNIGLVVAAAAVLVAAIWLVAASRVAAGEIGLGRTEGSARFGQLTQARILASRARTAETMQLIAHGDPTGFEKDFHGTTEQLASILAAGYPGALAGLQRWTDSHRRQVDAYLIGDYQAAVQQAIGSDPNASAAQYAAVESSLRGDIEQTRSALRGRVAAAGGALAWAPTGVLALTIVAAASAIAGLWPRLKEFL